VKVPVRVSLTLSCTSRGSPPDAFTWTKDNSPIKPTPPLIMVIHNSIAAVFRSEYVINSVNTRDSGRYSCIATNPIGRDSQTISVIALDGESIFKANLTHTYACGINIMIMTVKVY